MKARRKTKWWQILMIWLLSGVGMAFEGEHIRGIGPAADSDDQESERSGR
ncbi:MAG: hypothetical protein WDN76_03980 [Alphaproteobacteria bacterium]